MTLTGRTVENTELCRIQNIHKKNMMFYKKENHNFSTPVLELLQFRLNDESQDICTHRGKISVTQRGECSQSLYICKY